MKTNIDDNIASITLYSQTISKIISGASLPVRPPIKGRIDTISAALSLSEIEHWALATAVSYEINGFIEGLPQQPTFGDFFGAFSIPLKANFKEISILKSDMPLCKLFEESQNNFPIVSKPLRLKKDVFYYIIGASESLPFLSKATKNKITLDDIEGNVREKVKLFIRYAKYGKSILEKSGFIDKTELNSSGTRALFYGESGTGKTLAAHAAANELSLPIRKISLSEIFDKYVGETEKNLDRIFSDAEKSPCLLLFDEAESLFTKRTDTESSHDKYANLSAAFLLSRIEDYSGTVILTSNLPRNFDAAFSRRLQFTIKFPLPDKAERIAYIKKLYPSADDHFVNTLAEPENSYGKLKENLKLELIKTFEG
jgi:SpoVK/Ycf46/Vps4 family AAA+-type ATPase